MQLDMGLFYKDTAGNFDELDPRSDNTGLNKINELRKLNKTVLTRKSAY